MGVYQRLTDCLPKQSCVLCGEQSAFCVCSECESQLKTQKKRCLSCACKLPVNSPQSDLDFCGACLTHSPYFSKSFTVYDYAQPCAQLIKQFKFQQQLCVGDYFAHQLYEAFVAINKPYDVIIPMPLSKARIKERGYNQTQELLRVMKKQTDVPIDASSVKRIKATQALSSLNLVERKKEIKGAFSTAKLNYDYVLLVDDVMTTGASLNELAKTLIKQGGVKSCDVLTLARA